MAPGQRGLCRFFKVIQHKKCYRHHKRINFEYSGTKDQHSIRQKTNSIKNIIIFHSQVKKKKKFWYRFPSLFAACYGQENSKQQIPYQKWQNNLCYYSLVMFPLFPGPWIISIANTKTVNNEGYIDRPCGFIEIVFILETKQIIVIQNLLSIANLQINRSIFEKRKIILANYKQTHLV